MTDAFRCDICEEFYGAHYRFISAEMDTDAVAQADFTLDDIGSGAFGVFPERDDDNHRADICADCGRRVIEELIELKTEMEGHDGE